MKTFLFFISITILIFGCKDDELSSGFEKKTLLTFTILNSFDGADQAWVFLSNSEGKTIGINQAILNESVEIENIIPFDDEVFDVTYARIYNGNHYYQTYKGYSGEHITFTGFTEIPKPEGEVTVKFSFLESEDAFILASTTEYAGCGGPQEPCNGVLSCKIDENERLFIMNYDKAGKKYNYTLKENVSPGEVIEITPGDFINSTSAIFPLDFPSDLDFWHFYSGILAGENLSKDLIIFGEAAILSGGSNSNEFLFCQPTDTGWRPYTRIDLGTTNGWNDVNLRVVGEYVTSYHPTPVAFTILSHDENSIELLQSDTNSYYIISWIVRPEEDKLINQWEVYGNFYEKYNMPEVPSELTGLITESVGTVEPGVRHVTEIIDSRFPTVKEYYDYHFIQGNPLNYYDESIDKISVESRSVNL